jgi:NitT/TauT family transport system substrate-binding protein
VRSKVLGLILAGCVLGGVARADDAPTPVRAVVTFLNSIPAMAGLQVANQRGYFKDSGLDFTFASALGGGDTLRPLTTGDADITIGSPAASTLATLHNPDLKIAAIWLPYNAFYFIGVKPIADLKGIKVGGGVGASTVNLLLVGLGEKLGMPFDEQRAGTGSMADDWDATKAGQLQATWALEPFLTERIQQDHAVVVIDAPKYIPWFPSDFVVVNDKFAKTHPDAMKKFFVVVQRMFGEFNDPAKLDGLSQDLAKVMVFPASTIATALKNTKPEALSGIYSLKMNADDLTIISHLLVVGKLVHEPVDWSKLIDQAYLPPEDQLAKLP